ncbi:hypothetical protein [Streptomyces youssoufiensis]
MAKPTRLDYMTDDDIKAEIARLRAETKKGGAEISPIARDACRDAIDTNLDELNRRQRAR